MLVIVQDLLQGQTGREGNDSALRQKDFFHGLEINGGPWPASGGLKSAETYNFNLFSCAQAFTYRGQNRLQTVLNGPFLQAGSRRYPGNQLALVHTLTPQARQAGLVLAVTIYFIGSTFVGQ